MSRKGHSFLPEYPRIRVDRFTESRERIPGSLQPQWHDGALLPGPWEDLALGDDEQDGYAPESDDEEGLCASSSQQRIDAEFRQSSNSAREASSSARRSQPVMPQIFPHPTIQLLTHIHIDHLEGLNTPFHNGAPIYCSAATKEMLLRLEPAASRKARDRGQHVIGEGGRKRPYAWLRRTQEQSSAIWKVRGIRVPPHDFLHELPFNTPTEVKYLPGVKVRITLLDSNHMTGGAMFLVEGHRGAVLHMGDCRAEKWWLEALVRNPVMQRYACFEDENDDDDSPGGSLPSRIGATPSRLAAQQSLAHSETQATSSSTSRPAAAPVTTSAAATAASVSRKSENPATNTPSPDKARRIDPGHLRLQRIVIDDEWSSIGGQPPGKRDAARDLVRLLEKYPKDTQTQVDGWTWGYEDVYVAIGKMLRGSGQDGGGAKIHVDRYKFDMYTAAKDPCIDFMTRTATSTRFHACDMIGECAHLQDDDLSQRAAETEAYASLSQGWHGPAVLPLSQRQIESVRASAAAKRASQQQPRPPPKVLVRIIEADEEAWAELQAKSHAAIDAARRGEGDYPPWLPCPIQRHTTLPELQQFVRAFRPRNVTPQTSDMDKFFVVAKFIGPCLDKDGKARLEAEAKEAMGVEEWEKCEEALRLGEGESDSSSQQRRQAQQLAAFRAARSRKTLDLSQESSEKSKKRKKGKQQPHQGQGSRAGMAAQLSQQRIAIAATVAAITGSSPDPADTADQSIALALAHQVRPSSTALDDDLARRYFIVLRNTVQPGIQLENLPGGAEGPQAWRAVRIVAPHLAIATEQIMEHELGIVPPQWRSTPAATPSVSRSASGAGGAEEQKGLGVGPSKLRNAHGPREESGGSASSAQLTGSSNNGNGNGGWIHQHLLWCGNAPLRLYEDLCCRDTTRLEASCKRLDAQTASFVRILGEALQREDGSLAIARQHSVLCDPLVDALGIVGQSGEQAERGVALKPETLLRLVALTDVALQLAAFIFAAAKQHGVALDEAVEGQLTISLVECAKGVEVLLKGLDGKEAGGKGGSGKGLCGRGEWKKGSEREDAAVLLKRVQKTLGMVEEEARR